MKAKSTPSETKAIIRSVAILSYLQDHFYEKYPDGVPELLEIQELIDEKDTEATETAAKTLVEEAVSDLLWIVEKYRAK